MLDIAAALEKHESLINSENAADVAAATKAGYAESLVSRLQLKTGKVSGHQFRQKLSSVSDHCSIKCCFSILQFFFFFFFPSQILDLAKSIRKIADMKEPLGRVLKRTEVSIVHIVHLFCQCLNSKWLDLVMIGITNCQSLLSLFIFQTLLMNNVKFSNDLGLPRKMNLISLISLT